MNGQGSPNSYRAAVRTLNLRVAMASTVVLCCAIWVCGIATAQSQPVFPATTTEPPVANSLRSYPSNPYRTALQQTVASPAAAAAVASAAVADIDLRLRIRWQSPNKRLWIGNLFLPNGLISDVRLLESDVSEPGSYVLPTTRVGGSESLFVAPRVPSRRSGFEVNVRGPADAELILELIPNEDPAAKQIVRVPLRDLAQKDYQELMGDGVIWIGRSPGDRIRVQLEHDSLVFGPGETLHLHAWANELNVRAGANLKAKFRLRPATASRPDVALLKNIIDDDNLWTHEETWRIGEQGNSQSKSNIRVPVPTEEGVYELSIDCVLPLPQVGTAARRKVQFVVVDDTKASQNNVSASGTLRSEFNPAEPKWYEQLPQWTRLPRTQRGPWGNINPEVWENGNQRWTRIGGGGWIAYSLQVDNPGVPHVVDVEFPGHLHQGVQIGIFEPSDQSDRPNAVLSGLEIGDPDVALNIPGQESDPVHQRLAFWPKTTSPILVLSNQSNETSATFGRIRLEAYHQGLPTRGRIRWPTNSTRNAVPRVAEQTVPYLKSIGNLRRDTELDAASDNLPLAGSEEFRFGYTKNESTDVAERRKRILVMGPEQWLAQFAPRRPENDRLRTRFDNWRTFKEATDRMIGYLHYAGYDGVSLTVHGKGSSLYPSRLLNPTPQFDRGIFATRGQDPVRKDVLEYLLRRFDREELTLVPAIEFTSPLPELERMLPPPTPEGIELVKLVDGERKKTASAPYYNPLDARVQLAMQNVLQELIERYGQHDSFGGVRLEFLPESFTHLPDVHWGVDRNTVAAFRESLAANSNEQFLLPGSIEDTTKRLQDEAAAQDGELTKLWLRWRSERLADFYRRLSSLLDTSSNLASPPRQSNRRLYLSMAGLNESLPWQRYLRPSLQQEANVTAAMLALGLDLRALMGTKDELLSPLKNNRLVVLRPQPFATMSNLTAEGGNMMMRSLDAQKSFAVPTSGSPANGLLGPSHPVPQNLATLPATEFRYRSESFSNFRFDALPGNYSLSDPSKLEYTVSYSGNDVRKPYAQSLARFDDFVVFEGGASALLGQEQHADPFFDVFRRIPAIPFSNVRVKGQDKQPELLEPKPLVIRRATYNEKTYIYVVNPSPWTVHADLELHMDESLTDNIEVWGTNQVQSANLFDRNILEFDVRPFGAVLFKIDSTDVDVLGCKPELPNRLAQQLMAQLLAIRSRAGLLADLDSTTTSVSDPGFETPLNSSTSWTSQIQAPQAIGLDEVASDTQFVAEGNRSLRMKASTKEVSATSQPFKSPATGRLALSFKIRSNHNVRAPMAIRLVSPDSDYRTSQEITHVAVSTEFQRVLVPFTGLPTNAANLQIQLEMIGAGEVWIDDLKLNDKSFSSQEQNSLERILHTAFQQQLNGDLLRCYDSITGYWPRFLIRHVNPVAVARKDALPVEVEQPPQKQRFFDRWKLPRIPSFHF